MSDYKGYDDYTLSEKNFVERRLRQADLQDAAAAAAQAGENSRAAVSGRRASAYDREIAGIRKMIRYFEANGKWPDGSTSEYNPNWHKMVPQTRNDPNLDASIDYAVWLNSMEDDEGFSF